jgi:hypothetical protein
MACEYSPSLLVVMHAHAERHVEDIAWLEQSFTGDLIVSVVVRPMVYSQDSCKMALVL